MSFANTIVITDRKGGDVEFKIDGLNIPGVTDYSVDQPLNGFPRVTFTVLAEDVSATIKARFNDGFETG